MNDLSDIIRAFDDERRATTLAGCEIESIGSVLVQHFNTQHCVIWCNSSAAELDEAVEAVLDRSRAWRGSMEWKWFSHDPNADELSAALGRHGFVARDSEKVMVAPVTALPDTNQPAVIPVETARHLSDFKTTAGEIFGKKNEFITWQLSDDLRQSPRRHFGFLACESATPVGVGRVYLNAGSRFAYLAGGGVLPGFRRRGHYRNLVFARVAFARQHGYPYVMTDALPTSRPILQAIGLRAISETRPYTITLT